jgi:peroxiredoxin
MTQNARPRIGDAAPPFQLASSPTTTFDSSELRGSSAVLVFYPADWSPVCGDQLALYQALAHEFDAFDAKLVGLSVDGVWCHAAYAAARGLAFPLLSDFEPKGETARQYGVYREGDGVAERALFVLDEDGNVAWSQVVAPEVNPGADGILNALDNISRSAHDGNLRATPAPADRPAARA